ncbi:HypC/HybG/HupF family hydrogenase formation chaperone [Frateuria defendens]|uniref:HypC/HybG/HupF family hydrogenase formation chaperone n=1 Tax=Frateuria defendens TaxID=2219559 RepID=UPI00066FE4A1|nr:HypC/HybG/HupF family hydrogenase formation chaperone [Frateuria defendens]
MCMGLPMTVVAVHPGHADCEREGQRRRVNIALVGPVRPGERLLVFLDSAIERLSAARAAEIDAVLAMLASAMEGDAAGAGAVPGFALPSQMPAASLAALTGLPPPTDLESPR